MAFYIFASSLYSTTFFCFMETVTHNIICEGTREDFSGEEKTWGVDGCFEHAGSLEFTKSCQESAVGKQDPTHMFAKSELFNKRMRCSKAEKTPTLTPPIPASQALSSPRSHFALIAILCREVILPVFTHGEPEVQRG